MDAPDAGIEELVVPLIRAMNEGGFTFIVARPSAVTGERVGAVVPVDVPWSAAEHARAIARLQRPCALDDDVALSRGPGSTILVQRAVPEHATERGGRLFGIEDLAQQGWISLLAARTIEAAVSLGRNVMLVGPRAPSLVLGAALIARGSRPAVAIPEPGGGEEVAIPQAQVAVTSVREVHLVGADRVGLWGLPGSVQAQWLPTLTGGIGWLDAPRIDRALMRYEVALGAGSGVSGPDIPVHVLAGIDLLVRVARGSEPRVVEVAELVVAGEGYRPRPLFGTGVLPAPDALVPLAVPSFASELRHAGDTVLADELGSVEPPAATPAFATASEVPLASSVVLPAAAAPPHAFAAPGVAGPPPGWELDALGVVPATPATTGSADAATMAATFGLGPPPPPSGRAQGDTTARFAEALQRAQKRAAAFDGEDASGT